MKSAMSAAGLRVVVVTFEGAEDAALWKTDTACSFTYVRNPDLSLYNALGLQR